MKMLKIISIPLVIIVFSGISCSIESDISSVDSEYGIIINSGTSYGMCIGYCIRSLDLSGTEAEYNMISYQPEQHPYKSIKGMITIIEWNDIVAEINEDTIKSMKDVYGCPDCADGGAEWLELITDSYSKKITFEVNDVPHSIVNLVSKLRAIRKTFAPDYL